MQEHTQPLRNEIAQQMSLATIRYSQVWEDAELLRLGLEIGPEDDVLSIMSSGDNALSMLIHGARSVMAVDMSPAQVALFELKLSAIKALDHADFAAFWGARQHPDRVTLYKDALRQDLSEQAQAFWDSHQPNLELGPMLCGKLERYIHSFGQEFLPKHWSTALIDALYQAKDLDEQRQLLADGAFSQAFEDDFRWYFGREMMEKNGRDPAQFKYVEGGDVGLYFYKRFRWVISSLPIQGNFYLESFLRAGYADLDHAPCYLRKSGFEVLKHTDALTRLSWSTDELERILSTHEQRFNKANLSDIFEYMSPQAAEQTFIKLAQSMRPAGRIAYWNLLVPRQPGEQALAHLKPLSNLSQALHDQDRSWFYRAFFVDQVR